jgi:hypothetical protein
MPNATNNLTCPNIKPISWVWSRKRVPLLHCVSDSALLLMRRGWDYSPVEMGPWMALSAYPSWKTQVNMEQWWNNTDGENQTTQRKNWPGLLPTTNLTFTDLCTNPGFRSERPGTNHPSYGTVVSDMVWILWSFKYSCKTMQCAFKFYHDYTCQKMQSRTFESRSTYINATTWHLVLCSLWKQTVTLETTGPLTKWQMQHIMLSLE